MRVHILHRLGQRRTVNIGYDFDVITCAITAKCIDEQFGAKRRSTNADMQYMADIAHQAGVNGLNQSAHALLKRVGISDRIGIASAPFGGVLCRAPFGHIDCGTRKQSRFGGMKLHVVRKLGEMA